MPTLLRGCDVSDYQSSTLVDWTKLDFGIVKATDGVRPMQRTAAHVAAIRTAIKSPSPSPLSASNVPRPTSHVLLGLYHFLRGDQSAAAQFKAFEAVAKPLLFLGDILPCIDIEDHPGFKLEKSPAEHVERALEFACACGTTFGGCILYISNRDWTRLGKPSWMLDYPLWVAHYPREGSTSLLARPSVPAGRDYAIWQCLVGPLDRTLQDSKNPKAVDQNLAREPLPLIGG